MSSFLYAIGIFVLFFIMLYGNYGRFATCVIKYSKKPVKRKVKGKVVMTQPKVSLSEQIPCYIPIWQLVVVRRTLYGYSGVFAPLSIVSIILMLFNIFISFVMPINGYVMLVAHLCMYIGIVINIVLYAIVTADCAKMYGFGNLCVLLNVIIPHLACTWMINNIPHIMSDMRKEKTFEESHGETIIKSKSNQ